ncbi:MAG: SDR family NAD(P)-dependent oxidoreductase [Gammaproteobacteria bacterium]
MAECRRPAAVVTGASAGLGAEFARQLAARGYDLLLVARRTERLAALAAELSGRHGVTVHTLGADLAEPATPRRIVDEITRCELEITGLVNNAGYGVPGSYLGHDWSTHAAFQQVMVNATAELCHRLMPRLRSRGDAWVVNVASLAGLMPGSAGHTLYAPAKAWLVKFSECLALEVRPYGVRVTALCPGFTRTEFHDVNGMRPHVSRLPAWLWLSAEEVVTAGLAAVERGVLVHVPGRVNRALALAARLLPGHFLRAMIASRERDFRRLD